MAKIYLLALLCALAWLFTNPANAATYTVNSLADPGTGTGNSGSLRYCITQANANTGPHTIVFTGIATGSTIVLNSDLPMITRSSTTLDATTVTGYVSNQPGIYINANGNNYGLHVRNAGNFRLYGFMIHDAGTGLYIEGDTADGFIIGAIDKRNVINRCTNYQLHIHRADLGTVYNNYIGCDISGTSGYSTTGSGIYLQAGANTNSIGGVNAGEGNLIAGGTGAAVYIGTYFGPATDGSMVNTFYGNRFGGTGTDMAWWSWVFWIDGNSDNNVIGGVLPGQGNDMQFGTNGNSANGYGNLVIGINETAADNNRVRGNNMHGAFGYGIVLAAGGNNNQPAPVITGQSGNILSGTSTPNALIDIYNGTLENSVYSQCKGGQYIVSTTADASGNWSVDLTAYSAYNDSSVVATATHATNGTSQFTECFGPLVLGNAQGNSCTSGGNVAIFSNYDGGYLNINVDQNIPDLKIGITTYEKTEVNFTGPYVGNITQVIYAGFDGQNNHCSPSPPVTSINGVPSNIVSLYCATCSNGMASPTLQTTNGNDYYVICNYSCDTANSQGGCNTPDQVVAYYLNQFGGRLYSHFTQYACFSGTYNLSAGGNCCIGADSIPGCTLPGAAAVINGAAAVCAGQQNVNYAIDTIAGATGYNWVLPAGATIVSGSNTHAIVVNYSSNATNGDISVTGTNPCGSGASAALNITVNTGAQAGAIAAPVDSICSGNALTLTASGYTGTLQWQQAATAGGSFTNINNATLDTLQTQYPQTTYLRVVANNAGCTDTSALFAVNIKPTPAPPVLNAADSLFCVGDSVQVCATGTGLQYLWNNGETTACIQAKAAGGYWLSATAANGCSTQSGRLNLAVHPVSSVSLVVNGDTLISFGASAYQWYKDGQPINGATNSSYVVADCGDYFVEITDNNGCKAASQAVQLKCTGIDEIENETLLVYPNPAGSILNVKLSANNNSTALYTIYNLPGQAVLQGHISGQPVSIATLPPGKYVLQVQLANGVVRKGFVKE